MNGSPEKRYLPKTVQLLSRPYDRQHLDDAPGGMEKALLDSIASTQQQLASITERQGPQGPVDSEV